MCLARWPGPAGGSVRERLQRTVVLDCEDRLRRPRGLITTHARRIAWHAGHGEADDVGAVGEQPFHRLDRYVAFEDVTVDDSGVARSGLVGNAEIEPALPALRVVFEVHIDVALRQVPDPARAAASTRVAPHIRPNAVEPGG